MGEAIMTARYLTNLTPTTVLNDKALSKIWNKKLAGYTNLKNFCYATYFHQNIGKIELKAQKFVFLGYPEGTNGWSLEILMSLLNKRNLK